MKRILITGANSYIGTSFEKYINESFPNDYTIDTVDMTDRTWIQKSFANYQTVFHVAGIVHQKETKENATLYYKVNRDLAVEVAKKAKEDGVKQFVFLSSMSVYGLDTGVITKETKPNPKTNYGKSKLQAEEQITGCRDAAFKVCILRTPMVYGEGCKGNYNTIIHIIKKYPIFPRVNNRRSMISINNLVAFVKMAVDQELDGLFFPQDDQYLNTTELAQLIAVDLGREVYMSRFLGFFVTCLKPFSKTLRKAFGSLIYKDLDS